MNNLVIVTPGCVGEYFYHLILVIYHIDYIVKWIVQSALIRFRIFPQFSDCQHLGKTIIKEWYFLAPVRINVNSVTDRLTQLFLIIMCCKFKSNSDTHLLLWIINIICSMVSPGSGALVVWHEVIYSLKNSYIGRTKVFLTSKCLYVFVIWKSFQLFSHCITFKENHDLKINYCSKSLWQENKKP